MPFVAIKVGVVLRLRVTGKYTAEVGVTLNIHLSFRIYCGNFYQPNVAFIFKATILGLESFEKTCCELFEIMCPCPIEPFFIEGCISASHQFAVPCCRGRHI